MNEILKSSGLCQEKAILAIRTINKMSKIGQKAVISELEKIGLKKAEKLIEKLKPENSNKSTIQKISQYDISELEESLSYCQKLEVSEKNLQIDPSLARGLDYYTGLIFEVFSQNADFGSLCAGGRYDNLCGIFCARDFSGVGVSFGFERIMLLLEKLKLFQDESSLFRDQKKKRKMKSRSNEWKMVNKRQFLVPCQNFPAEILFVRHSDIPQYVQYGAADFGIIGENLLYENDFKVRIIKKLGFGKCDLVLAVPKGLDIEKISELEGERIATFYPNSLRKFLEKEKINAAIVEIKGVVEVTPALGLANAICDITQTGKTLRKNNLKPIVTILKSEAVLIKSMIKKKKNGCLK